MPALRILLSLWQVHASAKWSSCVGALVARPLHAGLARKAARLDASSNPEFVGVIDYNDGHRKDYFNRNTD